MKKLTILLGLCGLSMLYSSCDNYDDLIPQKYNTILSMKQYGEQDIILYRTGENTEFEITAMKTGSVTGTTAAAKISSMSQAAFAEYLELAGKSYKYLPQECFSIQNGDLDYSGEDTWKRIKVLIDYEKTAPYVLEEKGRYVIPLVMTSESDSILSTKRELILKMSDVIVPNVSFGGTQTKELSRAGGVVEVPLNMQIANKWNFTAKVEIDEAATTLNGVSLADGGVVNFAPGGNGKVQLQVPAFTTQTIGNVGLKIKSIDGKDFNYDEGVFNITAAMEKYPLTPAMLSSNAVEPTEGSLANLLDGDINTFFHSAWSVDVEGLHHVQVTLPKPIKVCSFSYTNRATNANAALAWLTFYAGTSEDDLEEVKTFAFDTDNLPWDIAGGTWNSPDITFDKPVSVLRFENPDDGTWFRGKFFVWSEFCLRAIE